MILPKFKKHWPMEALEAYKERVAIMIIDGIVPPEDARKIAEDRVRREWLRRNG